MRRTRRVCHSCGDLHWLDAWPHNCLPASFPRSELAAPMVIRDGMDTTVNHADGRRYDSKRAYEKAVKAKGCEIVANEALKERPRWTMPSAGQDVKRAIEELKSR